ncbi:hypothetical protein [Lactobacillus sp. Sy-1]|uniref:hypothetical protein n=1 Tax=Lactobacillus sp. Sy-1 TaxID=2109645 RepID=UPI001C5AF78A|nr:hypothetical protein [Lactobacillus sp. Sy-1]MBW1605857.1 hypothetical protein [Lactobacillus sp. Sy-1]
MKSTTIASEETRSFYVKLKRSPMADWFVPELEHQVKIRKIKIPRQVAKGEFKISRFGYFNKHAWYFFNDDPVTGWLPLKSVRNNYRRLAVSAVKQPADDAQSSYATTALMLLRYAGSDVTIATLSSLFNNSQMEIPLPADFFTIIVQQAGSFKNLSNKKLRRLRKHLRRERPIMMWVGGLHGSLGTSILLTGFNKKLFFYIDPQTGTVNTIAKKQLLKRWKAANFLAISY